MTNDPATVLDRAIWNIYQRAHQDHPTARLDPSKGELGRLWSLWDWAIQQEGAR